MEILSKHVSSERHEQNLFKKPQTNIINTMGNLLEMPTLSPHPRCSDSEALGVEPSNPCFGKPEITPDDPDMGYLEDS